MQVQNFRYFDGSTELKELEHSQMGHTRLEELGNGNATAGVARLWRCERDERYTQLAGKTLVERVTLFYWCAVLRALYMYFTWSKIIGRCGLLML